MCCWLYCGDGVKYPVRKQITWQNRTFFPIERSVRVKAVERSKIESYVFRRRTSYEIDRGPWRVCDLKRLRKTDFPETFAILSQKRFNFCEKTSNSTYEHSKSVRRVPTGAARIDQSISRKVLAHTTLSAEKISTQSASKLDVQTSVRLARKIRKSNRWVR